MAAPTRLEAGPHCARDAGFSGAALGRKSYCGSAAGLITCDPLSDLERQRRMDSPIERDERISRSSRTLTASGDDVNVQPASDAPSIRAPTV